MAGINQRVLMKYISILKLTTSLTRIMNRNPNLKCKQTNRTRLWVTWGNFCSVSMLNKEIHQLKKEVRALKEADRRHALDASILRRNQVIIAFIMGIIVVIICYAIMSLGRSYRHASNGPGSGKAMEQVVE
ncbi:hypothetical protein ACLOJK_008417 [Asimina triloba]